MKEAQEQAAERQRKTIQKAAGKKATVK